MSVRETFEKQIANSPFMISPLVILRCSFSCCHQFLEDDEEDSSILILLALLRRQVFALFSLSSENRNSVVLVLVEDLRELA